MRRFFAADGEKDACGDDGGLRISVDVDALALVSLALLSFEGIFRICIFNDLIVDNCLPLVDFFVMILRKRDDRDLLALLKQNHKTVIHQGGTYG
jgi:hypothetical protein